MAAAVALEHKCARAEQETTHAQMLQTQEENEAFAIAKTKSHITPATTNTTVYGRKKRAAQKHIPVKTETAKKLAQQQTASAT